MSSTLRLSLKLRPEGSERPIGHESNVACHERVTGRRRVEWWSLQDSTCELLHVRLTPTATINLRPSWASPVQMADPIPLAPPVTIATSVFIALELFLLSYPPLIADDRLSTGFFILRNVNFLPLVIYQVDRCSDLTIDA